MTLPESTEPVTSTDSDSDSSESTDRSDNGSDNDTDEETVTAPSKEAPPTAPIQSQTGDGTDQGTVAMEM